MYYKTRQIVNVYSAFDFYKSYLICNIGNGTEAHLTFFDETLNKTARLENTSYDFFVYKDFLFFTSQTIIVGENKILKSFRLDLESREIEELPYTLYIKGVQRNNNYFCWGTKGFASDNKDSFYFLIDLNTFKIEREIPKAIGLKRVELFTPEFIIFSNRIKGVIGSYNYTGKELWQKDLSQETAYTDWDGNHKGVISRVYSYKNLLIVLAGRKILALAIDTGEILWKLRYKDFTPYTLHIIGNKGYLARGAFYSVIDLDKGEKILDTVIDSIFNREKNYQNNYAMVGSDITYREGKIYFSDKQDGKYYLFCLNPETGIIEDYLFLEGIDSNLTPPKFHKDKMYLLDNKSTLHIYRKEINKNNN